MDKFPIFLTEHAVKDLKAIPAEVRERIDQDLLNLQAAPFPSGVHIKKLRGFRPPLYRLRSGDFRVLYKIQEETVTILRVIDRKVLERTLKMLGREF